MGFWHIYMGIDLNGGGEFVTPTISGVDVPFRARTAVIVDRSRVAIANHASRAVTVEQKR